MFFERREFIAEDASQGIKVVVFGKFHQVRLPCLLGIGGDPRDKIIGRLHAPDPMPYFIKKPLPRDLSIVKFTISDEAVGGGADPLQKITNLVVLRKFTTPAREKLFRVEIRSWRKKHLG